MIEKFTDAELEQIKKELGITKTDLRKTTVFGVEAAVLDELWAGKPFANNKCVFHIIDITLCNVIKHKNSLKGKYGTSIRVNEKDMNEYCQMFQEILEIIKKHNRKWDAGAN